MHSQILIRILHIDLQVKRVFLGLQDCHSLICIGLPNQSHSQSLLTSYGACSTKMKTLERTGSKSLQIVNLLNCITFQTAAQHRLRIGPFQSPFSLSMARHIRSQKALGQTCNDTPVFRYIAIFFAMIRILYILYSNKLLQHL